jgi:hypothetical protein
MAVMYAIRKGWIKMGYEHEHEGSTGSLLSTTGRLTRRV